MNTISHVIPVLIVVGISVILKISNHLFVLNSRRKSNKKKSVDISHSMMNLSVSYEQFEAVSKEALTPNSPMRINSDFFCFFMQHITADADSLQNKVLTINCGEDYE
ncbi:MAG: hypothetical protein K1W20_09030 [Lachnospiraceae bacterium]